MAMKGWQMTMNKARQSIHTSAQVTAVYSGKVFKIQKQMHCGEYTYAKVIHQYCH